jgi:fucose permease
MRQPVPAPVLVSYVAFVLVGVSAGVGGVLLLAQMGDYGVGRATIGIIFFTGSAGFVAASLSTGALIHRFGVRLTLAAGGTACVLAGLCLAARPPFVAFVLVQLVVGYGAGILESALNVYLAALPDATLLLNRLHAFFGVGALMGPVLAAWVISFASWTVVWLILALVYVPLVAAFLVAYPRRQPPVTEGSPGERSARAPRMARGLLGAVLRQPGVRWGAVMLAIYVGLEISVGNWEFSYLVQARALARPLAGYSVSGYWLGLTLGRFLISPLAARFGVTTAGMMYACLAGVTVVTTLAWAAPNAALASVALMLLGFFLGPIFPTTMAIVPWLAPPKLAPTAIGVMNAAAVVGGAGLPWLAGTIAQNTGIWTLVPFTLTLGLLQVAAWRPLAHRIRASPVAGAAELCVRAASRRRCRAAGGELGGQAVEEGLQAELEAVGGGGRVVGGSRFEAGAQPRELGRDLSGFGHAVADQFLGVAAVPAEFPGERGRRGGAEGIAEHEGEDGRHGLVGLGGGEPGGLEDREAVVIVAGLARAVEQQRAERLDQPGMAGEHAVQLRGHCGGRRPPAGHGQVGQRDLVPHLVGGEGDQVLLAAHVPVDRGRRRAQPRAQGAHVQAFEARAVQQADGGVDDLLAGQRVARHAPTIGHQAATCT